jgi:hypothetical protein
MFLCSNKRATTIQKWVRMHIQRSKYRRDTIAGRRRAERAAAEARQLAAAIVIQKHVRRRAAQRKVRRPVGEARIRLQIATPSWACSYACFSCPARVRKVESSWV